jgi:hypothetical protein
MLGLVDSQAIGRHLGAYIAEESLKDWETVFHATAGESAERRSSHPLVIRRGAPHLPIYAHAIARKITDPETSGITTQMIWMDVSLEIAAKEDALRALKSLESKGQLFTLPRLLQK